MGDSVCTQGVEGEIHCKNTKKGDLSRCGNHTGITLLSITVLNRIVLNRIKFRVGLMLGDMQAGFRKNRTCTDTHINPGAICRVDY